MNDETRKNLIDILQAAEETQECRLQNQTGSLYRTCENDMVLMRRKNQCRS
jgi:hypothetical protein